MSLSPAPSSISMITSPGAASSAVGNETRSRMSAAVPRENSRLERRSRNRSRACS